MNRALETHGIVPLVDSVHRFADAAAACAGVGKVLAEPD